jgi:hypothetical protein
MRALLEAVAVSDATSYREHAVRYNQLQADVVALDRAVLDACSESLSGSKRLAPEVIQATIRDGYDRFRECYGAGLRRNPDLAGRVTVRLVIGRDGAVKDVQVHESPPANARVQLDPETESFFGELGFRRVTHQMDSTPIQDQEVVNCVLNGFRSLHFPRNESGDVTVVYPIQFESG